MPEPAAVTVDVSAAMLALDALEAAALGPGLAENIAEACAELTREHLEGLSAARHRPGNPHDFYLSAADSVLAGSAPGEATVTVSKAGFRQRLQGGEIRPSGRPSLATGKPVRRLAVPIPGTDAEFRLPAEFEHLFALAGKRRAVLAREGPGGKPEPLFLLLPKVRQDPDPTVLPPLSDYAARARAEILRCVKPPR